MGKGRGRGRGRGRGHTASAPGPPGTGSLTGYFLLILSPKNKNFLFKLSCKQIYFSRQWTDFTYSCTQ